MELNVKHLTNINTGLMDEELKNNKRNKLTDGPTLSYKQIVFQHVFTLFNGINVFLFILVCLTRSYQNGMFMGVVLFNLSIGIIQSIRAKKMLDKLTLLNQKKAKVIRNGKETEINIDEVVENDIVLFSLGDQISFDCVVVEGLLECNESNLTGESEPIKKTVGDTLFSASYIVAGEGKAQVVNVQEDTYAYSIIKEVKQIKKYPSELRDSLDNIVRFSTILLIPIGVLLYIKLMQTNTWQKATLNMVAAVIGMIPSGLVLLTSIALVVGTIRLLKQEVLIKELYCQETLARVDTLCLDKTGTITEGTMSVVNIDTVNNYNIEDVNNALKRMYGSVSSINATAAAIQAYIPCQKTSFINYVPFSSERKGMGFEFEDGCFICGSYTNLFTDIDIDVKEKIDAYAQRGMRVIVVAKTEELRNDLSGNHELMGIICIQDQLKKNIKNILDYFKKQDVDIKIISGDDASTIRYVTKQAGLDYEVVNIDTVKNISEIVESNQAFGRVKPEQKKQIIQQLKENGRVVAMIGDGVNDILALKEADCSITFKNGSEACQNICSIVLLDNQFETLPLILKQGRNVINNIEKSASLFLVKTLYSIGLSLLTLFILKRYPFIPVQLTLISSLTVGLPGFVLSMEPNDTKVSGAFLKRVFIKAVPAAGCIVLTVIILDFFSCYLNLTSDQLSTMAMILTAWNSYCFLLMVCRPFTRLRWILVIGVAFVFAGAIVLFPSIFSVVLLSKLQYIYLIIHIGIITFIQVVLHTYVIKKVQ